MREKISLLLVIFMIGLLVACNAEEQKKANDGNPVVFFTGTIEEINDRTAIVSSEYGQVFIDLSVNRDEVFQVGDGVIVGYDGELKESSPAQIRTISVQPVE